MLIPTLDGNKIRGTGGRVLEVVNKEEEDEDEKEQGLHVVRAGSGFRVFPFACRDASVCDVNKVLRLDPT